MRGASDNIMRLRVAMKVADLTPVGASACGSIEQGVLCSRVEVPLDAHKE